MRDNSNTGKRSGFSCGTEDAPPQFHAAPIAANVALREFQSAAFGFARPADAAGSCEFLTFFTVRDFHLGMKMRFWEACFAELQRRGLHIAYATTAARPPPIYRRLGGEVLAETAVESEARYFLRFSLARHWMRRAASSYRAPTAELM